MKKRLVVVISSLLCAFLVMSGGYGFWQKQLTITGRIEVRQEPVEAVDLGQRTLPVDGGGDIGIPEVPGDQTTTTETTEPINQEDLQTDANSGNEATLGETTEGIDNPSQQQNNDSPATEAVEIGSGVTVESTPTSDESSNSMGDTIGESDSTASETSPSVEESDM